MRSLRTHMPWWRSALIVVTSLALWLQVCPTAVVAAPVKPSRLRVCIDPGHGGAYTGASYGGVAEKTLNLQIARRLKTELERRGVEVFMTRNSDTLVYRGGGIRTWRWDETKEAYFYDLWPAVTANNRLQQDLQARCDSANRAGADLFVSVHCNAGGSSATGIEVYRSGNDPLGEQLAQDVLAGAVARTGAVPRGAKTEAFYVVRWTNMPAILVESGFMSNSGELARLRSAAYQQKLAQGIAEGVLKTASRPVAETYERIAGENRWATAAAVSRTSHPVGATTVVLASGSDFADSLVAGPLATSLGAPVLITEPHSLPAAVRTEIERLKPNKIVIVGGPNAVGAGVATEAAAAAKINASSVERIAGDDRYDTAVRVARRVHASEPATSVVVASGTSWADALSISASAAERREPIILSNATKLTDAAYGYITTTKPAQVTVVGGTAVLPDAALRGLKYDRLAGADRYATNWQVLQQRYGEASLSTAFLASGETYADALVLGPHLAAQKRPLLLVGKSTVASTLRPWVLEHKAETLGFSIAGGPAAVSAYVTPSHEKWRMNTH